MKPLLTLLVALGFVASMAHVCAQQPKARAGAARPTNAPRASGSGVVTMEVDYNTGKVSNVRMLKSTGNRILDNAATSAFSKYSYRPRTFRGRVQVPITFTLTGTKR